MLEKLQASLDELRTKKAALEAEQDEIEDKMKALKAQLYAKFGSEYSHPLLAWSGSCVLSAIQLVLICAMVGGAASINLER